MKRIYKNPLALLLGAAVVAAGAGIFTLSAFNPTNIAETTPDHKDALLRTRRYALKNDLKLVRRIVEQIVPTLTTWGGKWQLSASQNGDSTENKEIVRVAVPVVVFTDDLWIELKHEENEVIVNAHSNSRVGKGDLGENRRHLLQILEKLDAAFRNANS